MAERVGISPVMETANAESASERAPRTERANRGVDRFLHVQQAIGNSAMQNLLAGGLLQPKLRIGPVDDVYEREADRTADRVMRMPDPASDAAQPLQAPISRVQRMCPECEEEDGKVRRQVQDEEEEVLEKEVDESLQRKAKASAAPPVDAGIESHITSLRGGGRPLSPSVRSFFEPRFNHDFSDVRLHTGATAMGAANDINARAFTIGRDIMFSAGEYAPHTSRGRRLLGHELTHVVQQNSSAIRTSPVIQRALAAAPTVTAAAAPEAPIAPAAETSEPVADQGPTMASDDAGINGAPDKPATPPSGADAGSSGDPLEREADQLGRAVKRMPDPLRTGLETLSGMDLSGVRVHKNSSKPAQLNAFTYTQGQDIHVGPGQEKHLAHEGWHVVQQMQGRVKPTMQSEGVSINDDAALEREADEMGAKALQKMHVSQHSSNANVPDTYSRSRAAESTRALHAQAYTVKRDVEFGEGQYAPETTDGRRLLAHTLTHVVRQRGSKSSSIQRYICTNDPATAPTTGMAGCSTENSRPTHPNVDVPLTGGASTTIESADQAVLSTLAARWHADGRNDTVRIDGFSSCDGLADGNWKLSCRRAKAVENELKTPSDGTPGIPVTATFNIFAHGETEEFSTTTREDNRKVLVTLQPTAATLPGAVPAAGPTDFRIGRIPRSSQSRVFFARASSTLTANAITQIDSLKVAAPPSVRLEGFASMEEAGTLAQDRADAVEARLTVAPNAVTVTSAVGNAAATATRSDFAGARKVDIVIGAAASPTLDCLAVHPVGHPDAGGRINPPTMTCATMDPATLTAFSAALPIANAAMTAAMNAINPAHADHNPTLILRFFGNNDPATLATLATNMGNLQTHVSGLSGSLGAPINGITEITRCGGQCDIGKCESGWIAYNSGVDAASINTLCVPVFKRINANDQARNLIHESAHGTSPLGGTAAPTRGTRDLAYRHERMLFHLSPADRMRNSDSYALFALFAKEVQSTGIASATPSGIAVPENDTITGITGADRNALELAIAQLEKRLTWAQDHTKQLFGRAQRVRAGAIAWSASARVEARMREAAARFPLTAPPAPPTLADMTTLAAILERYRRMRRGVNRDLTISDMPAGVINWPAGGGGVASSTLEIGPDFFRASPDSQVSLLLESLAASTRDVEPAFIPAYSSLAKFIHDNAT